jgi:transposase
MEKMYCGMDIHKDTITGCVLNKEGTIIRQHTFPTHKDSITTFLYNLPNANTEIAIETCGTWRGIHKILTHLGYTVKLADPRKIHYIAGNKKTDKGDAHILADLLRTRYLPEVYIPPQDILQLKDLTRHKVSLTRLRTQLQTKIKAYLLREGIDYKKTLWNKKSLADIAQHHPNLTNLVTLYQSFKKEEYEVMTRITNQAHKRDHTTLLTTIPGVGPYGSLMIYAEIGDIHRFPTPKHLISYAGLCPGIHQSGDTERNQKNNAVNKWLKWILYECSGRAAMLDPKIQDYYYNIKHKKGYKTARRATARKLLTIIWHILTNKEPYHPSQSTY